jgi:hypothetical protein
MGIILWVLDVQIRRKWRVLGIPKLNSLESYLFDQGEQPRTTSPTLLSNIFLDLYFLISMIPNSLIEKCTDISGLSK